MEPEGTAALDRVHVGRRAGVFQSDVCDAHRSASRWRGRFWRRGEAQNWIVNASFAGRRKSPRDGLDTRRTRNIEIAFIAINLTGRFHVLTGERGIFCR